jgi:hypothetical protein
MEMDFPQSKAPHFRPQGTEGCGLLPGCDAQYNFPDWPIDNESSILDVGCQWLRGPYHCLVDKLNMILNVHEKFLCIASGFPEVKGNFVRQDSQVQDGMLGRSHEGRSSPSTIFSTLIHSRS